MSSSSNYNHNHNQTLDTTGQDLMMGALVFLMTFVLALSYFLSH